MLKFIYSLFSQSPSNTVSTSVKIDFSILVIVVFLFFAICTILSVLLVLRNNEIKLLKEENKNLKNHINKGSN